MSLANPLWGAPRIHGELLKLGIDVGQTSVAKYMARHRRPPSQGWRTFLLNHVDGIASIDLFVVPTISFRLLYGLLILRSASNICVVCCARTSSTTTAPEHICHWAKTHRCREPSMPPGAFFRCASSADCITIMSGSDLRHGQPVTRPIGRCAQAFRLLYFRLAGATRFLCTTYRLSCSFARVVFLSS
jgi:hypothetical protein